MGDISDAGYFLSVLNILRGGPIHNYYIFLWGSAHLIGIWTPCHFDWKHKLPGENP